MRDIEQIKARARTNACDVMCKFGTAAVSDEWKLIKRVEQLEAALEFYADSYNWIGRSRDRISIAVSEDVGKIARQALGMESEQG